MQQQQNWQKRTVAGVALYSLQAAVITIQWLLVYSLLIPLTMPKF